MCMPLRIWGVCANGVEVAQRDSFQVIRVREVLQDHFHHVLGAGAGLSGRREFLCDHEARHHVINRRGGAEYHARVTQIRSGA